MSDYSRRDFVKWAAAGGLVLGGAALPTPGSGGLGAYGGYLEKAEKTGLQLPGSSKVTEDNILGPFHRKGAPFRAKITPPFEPGKVLVVSGQVWGHDTKKPLPFAIIDIWQANAKGRYDNDDRNNPPKPDVFMNRARIVTDEAGRYEYETIHPAPYKIGPNAWRPSHVHYLVRHNGYKTLITQMYFKGDKHNKTDDFIKDSLIMDVREQKSNGQPYEAVAFDIVLAKA